MKMIPWKLYTSSRWPPNKTNRSRREIHRDIHYSLDIIHWTPISFFNNLGYFVKKEMGVPRCHPQDEHSKMNTKMNTKMNKIQQN